MSIVDFLSTTQWLSLGPAPINAPGIGIGVAAGRVAAAAPDPAHADVMYVTGSGGGIWKTGVWNNDPPIWLSLGDDLPSLSFGGYHSLVVHPANSKLVLGAASGVGAGLLKSNPSTLSFQLLGNSTFEGASLGSIAVDPTNTSVMYVSTWSGGVYKSTDGGLTWQNLTSGFHAGGASDVIVPKTDPQTVYAGLVPSGGSGKSTAGVYKSTDGGAHWKLMNGLESGTSVGGKDVNGTFQAAIRLESSSVSGTVYVAIYTADQSGNLLIKRYKTTNGGGKWTKLAASPGNPEQRPWHFLLAVDPKDAKHVFANDAYALFQSTDGGQTWSSAEPANKIGDDWVNMSFDANNRGVVTSDQGVYRVKLENKKWTCCDGNLGVTQFYDVTLDPTNPDKSYGIGQDQRRVMKYSGSIEWDYVPIGSETGKLLLDPGNTKLLYVYSPQQPTSWVSRSKDGGQTWTTILTTNDFQKNDYGLAYSTQKSFVMDPSNSARLLLGSNQVLETKNAKAAIPTWASIGTPSPNQFITALAIAPSDGKTVYAATKDGHVWFTVNGGAQWKQRDTGLFGNSNGYVVDFSVDPANAKHLFAVTKSAGAAKVWRLGPANGFSQWVNITGNLPTNLSLSTIFVDWQYSVPALWVGTSRGVYQSVDSGQTWNKFAHDMPNANVTDLENSPSVNVLAAATSGRGLFEILIKPSKISGSAIQNPGNVPMAGASIFLDVNGSGTSDASEYHATTDAGGHYQFGKLPPGTYMPRVVPPAGFVQTSASTKSITVNGSNANAGAIVVQHSSQMFQVEEAETIQQVIHPVLPGGIDLLGGQPEDAPSSAPDEFDSHTGASTPK